MALNLTQHYSAKYARGAVASLPRKLDESVARLHLAALGVNLTKLTQAQAEFANVPSDGPFKPHAYRY
jgi:adenosylhomocysteinase